MSRRAIASYSFPAIPSGCDTATGRPASELVPMLVEEVGQLARQRSEARPGGVRAVTRERWCALEAVVWPVPLVQVMEQDANKRPPARGPLGPRVGPALHP